jgi:hypothetical protein
MRNAVSGNDIPIFVKIENPVGRYAFHGKRPRHPDFSLILIGLVVEIFKFRFGGYGSVDFLLPLYTKFPPFGV